ncbi:MAG: hypothetical protein CVV02_11930 [Firmicutes bacterium HGW-Firmicutes-7]|nr:MAG: hypothetical protein CVV02_11930 [Firmicutes bacterium HGW-Firmicutes-7]
MSYENKEINGEEIEILTPSSRVLSIFYSPKKVFKAINDKPNFWLPMIITMLFTMLFYLTFFGEFKEMLMEVIKLSGQSISVEYIEKMTTIISGVAIGFAPVIIAIGTFLTALFYWLGVMLFKGKGVYMKYVSLMAHVGLISLLSLVITGIMTILTGEFLISEPVTSLASWLPDSMNMTFLYGILLDVEVFNIWKLTLVAYGIHEIGGLKLSKAFIIVGIIFVIGILFSGGSLLLNARSF